jgi:hypothetical protein
MTFAMGRAATAGLASAQAAALAEKVVKAMLVAKINLAANVVAVAALLGLGASGLGRWSQAAGSHAKAGLDANDPSLSWASDQPAVNSQPWSVIPSVTPPGEGSAAEPSKHIGAGIKPSGPAQQATAGGSSSTKPSRDIAAGIYPLGAAQLPDLLPDEMTVLTESFSASGGEGADKRPVPLRRAPLLRWSDPTENLSEAAIWAWGERGRPYALVAIERYAKGYPGPLEEWWGLELISLTNERLELEATDEIRASDTRKAGGLKPVLGGAIHWTPERPGLKFQDVPGAARPAESAETRLLQMKDLIQRFSAVVRRDPQPGQLRLMPEPIARYSDAQSGQVDGAIFFFAIGTNPEVIVVLEAQGPSPGRASWQYAVARATVLPLEVALDDQNVWSAPHNMGPISTPRGKYYALRLARSKP